MKIDSTEFGSITIEGKRYSHDVVVSYKGKIEKGWLQTRHLINEKEFLEFLKEDPEVIVIGNKNATITVEADVYLPEKKVVISCKDSVRTKTKGHVKLIWDLMRYKYIEEVKGIKFYCPRVPNILVNLFKKYGIEILRSEKQLVKSL